MSRVSSRLFAGLSKLERGLGNPFFLFKGQKIPCVPASTKSQRRGEYGGFDDNVDFSVVVRKNLFLTIDDIDITIDNTNFTIDQYGNILPNWDVRRNTMDMWLAARRELVPAECAPSILTTDDDLVTIDDDVSTIDYSATWPLDTYPTLDAVAITIDDDWRVTVDAYTPGDPNAAVPAFPALPGKSPVTLDMDDLTIDHDGSSLTIDRHVSQIGYFDPIYLPDLNNIYLELLDADIERAKALLNTSMDFSLTIGTDGAWQSPFRVAGVYQEDQHLDWGRRPNQGEIIEYEGKQYRVIGEEDPGAFSAFFKLRLESALR